jgi:hypothetical protein
MCDSSNGLLKFNQRGVDNEIYFLVHQKPSAVLAAPVQSGNAPKHCCDRWAQYRLQRELTFRVGPGSIR